MKKLIVVLTLGLGGSILAMQKETRITLVGNDGEEVFVDQTIAQKIPTIQGMLESGLQEAETGTIKFELFDAEILRKVVNIVEQVYTQAPVLQKDPHFFEQTDEHPAYSPTDIPAQVRNIIIEQKLQNNEPFMQATDFLGLEWVKTAMQGGFSIADLVVYNRLPQVQDNLLNLSLRNITSLAGIYLLPQGIRDNLQKLRLSNNQLTTIAENIFAGLNNLRELHMSYNQLTTISDNAFAGLNNLRGLFLNGNELTTIPDNAFAALGNLQMLDLDGNELTTIADNAFAGLNNLRELHMSYNQLTTISDNAFAGLNNLRELLLDHNQLTTIPGNAFAALGNLQMLDLDSNELTTIADNAFAGLNNLRELHMKFNQLDQETKDRIRQLLPNVEVEIEF